MDADNCWGQRPRQVNERLGSDTDRHTGQIDGVVGVGCSSEVDFAGTRFGCGRKASQDFVTCWSLEINDFEERVGWKSAPQK